MKRTNCFTSNFAQVNQTHAEEINVDVKEVILTPLTCASIINEIIKCLLYQKSQIPYPYNWLKSVVNRKRKQTGSSKPFNLTVEQHYRVVSTAYDALEDLTKNLRTEFKNVNGDIQQVVILFGSTIYSPKEVFRIRLLGVAKGHSEEHHFRINSKNQHKILQNIILTQEWMNAMESAIPPTNMYVMIQKHSSIEDIGKSFFQPNMQYTVPSRVKNTVITLDYSDNPEYNCCDNLSVFEDLPKNKTDDQAASHHECVRNKPVCDLQWFQARTVLKGFKERFINNVSATELW